MTDLSPPWVQASEININWHLNLENVKHLKYKFNLKSSKNCSYTNSLKKTNMDYCTFNWIVNQGLKNAFFLKEEWEYYFKSPADIDYKRKYILNYVLLSLVHSSYFNTPEGDVLPWTNSKQPLV